MTNKVLKGGKMAKKTTKLEEAMYRLHLDIDGDKDVAITGALHTVKQLVQLVVGQEEIKHHDVNLVIQVLVTERLKNLPKPNQGALIRKGL